ncbi:hypothetical protein K402DRAFT_395795 [Aulographum hederae CBS 113979]|uniref:Uncharacterized protein n=1 Tax=Aulographum hederae CBS 113979 TaxID=1176131 RepID=A0A6G1GUJ6_9PEZI|nr:hypothetical protein K402DRAFT_395795 [Aulographum hederae CBS 113979]
MCPCSNPWSSLEQQKLPQKPHPAGSRLLPQAMDTVGAPPFQVNVRHLVQHHPSPVMYNDAAQLASWNGAANIDIETGVSPGHATAFATRMDATSPELRPLACNMFNQTSLLGKQRPQWRPRDSIMMEYTYLSPPATCPISSSQSGSPYRHSPPLVTEITDIKCLAECFLQGSPANRDSLTAVRGLTALHLA